MPASLASSLRRRAAGRESRSIRPLAALLPRTDDRRCRPHENPRTVPRRPSHRYSVYVVELDLRVWNEPRFRKANPDHELGKPLVYVGMTGLDPDTRFDKHKAGIQSNRYVRDHGLCLLPQLYEVYNPMPYEAAREMEVELAIGLRERGFGVWQG